MSADVAAAPGIASWHDDPVIKQILGNPQQNPISPGRGSNCTNTVADSLYQWTEPSQTLIFLDFDDTLFPTTDLFDRWGCPSRSEHWDDFKPTEEQERQLQKWRESLSEYLSTACSLSTRCVIVTNAKAGWVESCVARFVPELQSLFDRSNGPRVVYARDALKASLRRSPGSPRGSPTRYADDCMTEDEFHAELTKAKFVAMRQEAKKFYSQYPEQTWKNILSVGDAKYEHDAAQEVAFRRRALERERLRLKALLTPASPSVADLTYRLRLATILFPAYVQFDGDLDLDMNTPERLQAIADALEMPELRDVIRPTPIREEDQTALEEDLDEITIRVYQRLKE
eukprot:TRINITY_DN45289_c0_g1_i1.p1 TRINITY_DN45289_c0_g1~~TRINITY_DN45289_c0_g1_i1.p1  ORF type:complete len:342 (-),score=78.85 TRINITY_DN45289_c0_g1_i1:89-1114(-)